MSAVKQPHLGEKPEQQPAKLQALSQLQTQFQANVEGLNRLEVERTLLSRGLENSNSGVVVKTAPVTERARLEAERQQLKTQLQDLQNRYTSAHPEVVDAAARLQRMEDRLKALPPDPPVTAMAQESSAGGVRLQLLEREARRLNDEQ